MILFDIPAIVAGWIGAIFDGVKSFVRREPGLVILWVVMEAILIGLDGYQKTAALAFLFATYAYVVVALAVADRFERDRKRSAAEYRARVLRESLQKAVRLGATRRPFSNFGIAMNEAMAAVDRWVAGFVSVAAIEKLKTALYVEERRVQAKAVGMPDHWFDQIVGIAERASQVTDRSFLEVFDQWWDVVYRGWLSAVDLQADLEKAGLIHETVEDAAAVLRHGLNRARGLNDQGLPYLGIRHVPGVYEPATPIERARWADGLGPPIRWPRSLFEENRP